MAETIKCLFPNRVPREGLANLPLAAYSGKLVLVEKNEDVAAEVSKILKEKLLGFDTESRPSFRRDQNFPVSIIQLCGANCVWIFKLTDLGDSLHKVFSILENPNIRKVGVAVRGDILALGKLHEFNPAGFEDISEKTKKIGIVNTGLRNLSAVFLGQRISKSSQMSNWAAETLTKKQLTYAATDAWISRELYIVVNKIFSEKRYQISLVEDSSNEQYAKKQSIIARFFNMLKK
jgi:Ribonuclease D